MWRINAAKIAPLILINAKIIGGFIVIGSVSKESGERFFELHILLNN